jgi:hypothetical protein
MPSLDFNVGSVSFPPSSIGVQSAPQFVGVVNSGEAPLHIFSLSLIGPNASDFSLISPAACTAQAINPGAFCSFEVGFGPSIVGPEGASISFSDDATGTPQVIELKGQGGSGNQPLAVPAPMNFDFGAVSTGKVSLPALIKLRNNGMGPLDLTSVTLAGTDKLQFVSPFPGDSCVPGTIVQTSGACALTVTFSPTATGSFHAEIDFTDNSGGVPGVTQVVLLTGKGTLPAVANVSPAALDFGNQTIGTSSGAQAVTLASTGTAALNITGIDIMGSNAADFAIVAAGTNPCPTGSGTLVIGASCSVQVEFSPQSTGVKAASLTFTDNASATPQTVALGGTAVAAAAVQVSPTTWTFPGQSEGTPSAAKQFTVMNSGGSTVSIVIAVAGPNSLDFLETDNCSGAKGLAPGSSCLVNVSFDPGVLPPSQSARAASMTIAYGGAGTQLTVPLSGTATQPAVSFNLASINFGNQLAGTSGAAQGIQATNGGTGALVFSKIAISGSNPSDFAETDTCVGQIGSPTNIPPSGTCTVQVTFQPQVPAACGTAAGARSATLTLTDNAPGSPHTFPLGGTETDFCLIPQAGTAPGSISLGVASSYSIASYPGGSPNGFSGLVALTCTGFPAGGSCTAAPASMTVAAGSSAPFQVSVTAGAAGLLAPPQLRVPGMGPANWHGSGHEKLEPKIPALAFWRLAMILMALLVFLAALRLATPQTLQKSNFRRYVRASALLAAFAIGMAACGGGNNATDPGPTTQTYTLALTGTSACPSGSTCSTTPSRLVQLTLTVTVN